MSDNTNNGGGNSGGGNAGLAFIVGGILVVVAILAYFMFFRGGMEPATKDIDVDVNLPRVEAPAVPTPGPTTN